MRYTTTRQGGLELVISDEADWSAFERIAESIHTKFGAEIVRRLDGLDERYWDLEVSDLTVTLHLQHYLGISLYSGSTEADLLVKKVEVFLDNSNR